MPKHLDKSEKSVFSNAFLSCDIPVSLREIPIFTCTNILNSLRCPKRHNLIQKQQRTNNAWQLNQDSEPYLVIVDLRGPWTALWTGVLWVGVLHMYLRVRRIVYRQNQSLVLNLSIQVSTLFSSLQSICSWKTLEAFL